MPYAPTLTTLRLDAALVAERQADEEKRLARELDVRRELREKDAAFARDLELRRLQREADEAAATAAATTTAAALPLSGISPRAAVWRAEMELDSSRRAAARRRASLDTELAVAETNRALDTAFARDVELRRMRREADVAAATAAATTVARGLDLQRELQEKDAALARDLELRRLRREADEAAATAAATTAAVSLPGISPRAAVWRAELELDSSRRAAARRRASLDTELAVAETKRALDAAFARDVELRRLRREADAAAATAAATTAAVSLPGISPRAAVWRAELELDSSRRAAARRKASLDTQLAVAESTRALSAARARSLSPARRLYPAVSAALAAPETARLRAELASPLYAPPYSPSATLRALDAAHAEQLARTRSRAEWELALSPRSSWAWRLY